MRPDRYNKRELIELHDTSKCVTINARVIDKRSFGIERFILPELVVEVDGFDSPLQLRIYDKAMITNRQRFNRWNNKLELAYINYIKQENVNSLLKNDKLMRDIEIAVNKMHNLPIDVDFPSCEYSHLEREAYFHYKVKKSFEHTREYYEKLSKNIGQRLPHIHGYYTIQIYDDQQDDLLKVDAILMEDINSVYKRSNESVFDKAPVSQWPDISDQMFDIVKKFDEINHVDLHISLQSFKYRVNDDGKYHILIDDAKFGRFRNENDNDEQWRRLKRQANELNQLGLQILCQFEENGQNYDFKPSFKYHKDHQGDSINMMKYASYLNELGPTFNRYRRDIGYSIDFPYAVGDKIPLSVEKSSLTSSNQIDVEIVKIFQPVTVSPAMLVRFDNQIMVLKLYDRRCSPMGRFVTKDDNGYEDWNEDIEQDYRNYIENESKIDFNIDAYMQNESERDHARDEEVLRRNCDDFFTTELKTYNALEELQGNDIPKMYASVKYTTYNTPKKHLQGYFDIPGLLLEYIPGPKLDKMFESVDQSHWFGLVQQTTTLLHRMFDLGVTNIDARPDQVIVRAHNDGYHPVMIDFGECLLREDLHNDSDNNRWNIENNINGIMQQKFDEIGVEFRYEHKGQLRGWLL
ncbi:hypothetical protein E3Q18_02510 [Wallemia mellicola]|nr:hypothetical protein E3Q18_02510 [Wallemia mellicola]